MSSRFCKFCERHAVTASYEAVPLCNFHLNLRSTSEPSETGSDILSNVVTALAVESILDSSPSFDSSPSIDTSSSSDSFGGFDGGSSGGGGADSSW